MTIKTDLGFKQEESFELDKAIDYYLNNKPENNKKERNYFYMSELGCSKKELYQKLKNLKTSEKFNAKTIRALENGNKVHERFIKWFAEMGILVGAELEINNDLLHGRLDCLISDGEKNYIVEIKSCSMWTFNKLSKPSHTHLLQLQFYMYYTNIYKGILLYECKDNNSIKAFHIELDKPLVEKYIEELRKLKEDIIKGVEPIDEPLLLENLTYGI
jgi:hypothetical protein